MSARLAEGTAGQAGDSPQFIPVLDKIRVPGPVGQPRTRPDSVAGDKETRLATTALTCANVGSKAVPEKEDQAAHRMNPGQRGGQPAIRDKEARKLRNCVKSTINKIKDWRGLAAPESQP